MPSDRRYLISLTSVPRRFERALPKAVAALRRQGVAARILVNIPRYYRKWGPSPPLPTELAAMEGVEIFRPSEDHGPATKLLGALEYLRHAGDIDHVITVDDDIQFGPNHLRYLMECSRIVPGAAITVSGIRLVHHPFRRHDGLSYRSNFRAVHAPAGFRGVVYPVAPLMATDLAFTLRQRLPEGAFNDDDAYFACVLGVLGIPLLAVPGSRGQAIEGAGPSAVAERVERSRVENEMEIFQAAVRGGFLVLPPAPLTLSVIDRLRLFWSYLRLGKRWGASIRNRFVRS